MSKKYVDMTPEEQGEYSHDQWHYAIDRIPDLIGKLRRESALPEREYRELMALLSFAQVNILNMLMGKIPNMTVLGLDDLGGPPPESREHMH